MTVSFRLDGQEFTALNGGRISSSPSDFLCREMRNQAEVDRYWEKLGEGGDERAQQCGWLKDKFGVSWQIVPTALFEMMSGPDKEKSGRAMQAMLQMKKLDLPALRRPTRGIAEWLMSSPSTRIHCRAAGIIRWNARGDRPALSHRAARLRHDNEAPAFLSINPMGKGRRSGMATPLVTEAAAICAYLADAFPEARLRHRRAIAGVLLSLAILCRRPLEAAAANKVMASGARSAKG